MRDNVTVHRAADNSIDPSTRAARGPLCNGLLFRVLGLSSPVSGVDRSAPSALMDGA